jgi:hypothetical protein
VGTWLAEGAFSNASGAVNVSAGKQGGLFTAPLVPGTYYLYAWDSGDA